MKDTKRFRKEFTEAFIQRLRHARENTPQRYVHEYVASQIGMETKNGYGQIERGKSNPAPWHIAILCDLYGISPNWLFGFSGLPEDLSDDEQQVLSMYRRLRNHNRGPEIIDLLQALTNRLKEE